MAYALQVISKALFHGNKKTVQIYESTQYQKKVKGKYNIFRWFIFLWFSISIFLIHFRLEGHLSPNPGWTLSLTYQFPILKIPTRIHNTFTGAQTAPYYRLWWISLETRHLPRHIVHKKHAVGSRVPRNIYTAIKRPAFDIP